MTAGAPGPAPPLPGHRSRFPAGAFLAGGALWLLGTLAVNFGAWLPALWPAGNMQLLAAWLLVPAFVLAAVLAISAQSLGAGWHRGWPGWRLGRSTLCLALAGLLLAWCAALAGWWPALAG